MLVITRKLNESITIKVPVAGVKEESEGETIEITVIETTKDKVKLGVEAPREVRIIRSELLLAQNLNVEASKAVSKNTLEQLLQISEESKK